MKALITGASSGIGRDMARVLAKKGYNLVLVARDELKLNELAEELRKENDIETQVISMDLSIEQNCKDLHKSVKDVDILINNAGFGDCGNFTHTNLNKELIMIKTTLPKTSSPKLKPTTTDVSLTSNGSTSLTIR